MLEEEIKEALHRADIIMRPTIIFINPQDKYALLQERPDIEKELVLQESELIDLGKPCMVDRKRLEEWYLGKLNEENIENE